MYSINYTNRFKKDLKRCAKRGVDIRKIMWAVKQLELHGEFPLDINLINCLVIEKVSGNVISNLTS